MQCKDISTEKILEWLNNRRINKKIWACWFDGFENSIGQCMPEDVPDKLKIVKMSNLIDKGLVDGCGCGCRGDYEITEKGIEFFSKQS